MLTKAPFISEQILKSLKTDNEFIVHSVFENGINIMMNDRPVFLGVQDGPSSLCIDAQYIPVITNCTVGDKVKYKNSILYFDKIGLELDISNSKVTQYHISKQKIMSYMSEKFVKTVIGYDFITGLDLSTNDLIDDMVSRFAYDELKYLNYLLGRGRGLTPSGDDFILGMIAYHQVHPYLSDEFFTELNERLTLNVTTDISANYLNDAISGLFSRSIINLFESLQEGRNFVARIYEISMFGHSSGVDMLSGIVMGIIMDREMRNIYE